MSLLLLAVLLFWSQPLTAQVGGRPMKIEDFVVRVARSWAGADVGALVELFPAGTIVLDTGEGTEAANRRHAAAALRKLFSAHETVGARAASITVTSQTPPAGYGELAWTYHTRGAPGQQVRTVYIAMVAERGAWTITELRLMP